MSTLTMTKRDQPEKPAINSGRVVTWVGLDGLLRYINEDNEVVVLEKGEKGDSGETGAQGEQGLQGEKGDQGLQGPAGGIELIFKHTAPSVISIPWGTNYQYAYGFDVNFPVEGEYIMQVSMGIKPHHTGSDTKFLFGEAYTTNSFDAFNGEQIEEGKDTSNSQSNMRSWQTDLGHRLAGDLHIGLYSAMEKKEGYGEVKYLFVSIWRV